MDAVETPTAAVQGFFQAIIDKDAPRIMSFYWPSPDTYVILEGPRLATLGYDLIRKGWTDFVASPIRLVSIHWEEGPFCEGNRGLGWVAGIIRLRIQVAGKDFEQVFRGTFVLKRRRGRWLIRHEHVSGALQDPYGIGDWLKK
jgi:ketosteroid isomerase-like protein